MTNHAGADDPAPGAVGDDVAVADGREGHQRPPEAVAQRVEVLAVDEPDEDARAEGQHEHGARQVAEDRPVGDRPRRAVPEVLRDAVAGSPPPLVLRLRIDSELHRAQRSEGRGAVAAGGSSIETRRAVSGADGTRMMPRVGRSRSKVTRSSSVTSAAARMTVSTPWPTTAR